MRKRDQLRHAVEDAGDREAEAKRAAEHSRHSGNSAYGRAATTACGPLVQANEAGQRPRRLEMRGRLRPRHARLPKPPSSWRSRCAGTARRARRLCEEASWARSSSTRDFQASLAGSKCEVAVSFTELATSDDAEKAARLPIRPRRRYFLARLVRGSRSQMALLRPLPRTRRERSGRCHSSADAVDIPRARIANSTHPNGHTQAKLHLQRLVELEHVRAHRLCTYDPSRSGQTARGRGVVGPRSGQTPDRESVREDGGRSSKSVAVGGGHDHVNGGVGRKSQRR
jgi:hypothetical protein